MRRVGSSVFGIADGVSCSVPLHCVPPSLPAGAKNEQPWPALTSALTGVASVQEIIMLRCKDSIA